MATLGQEDYYYAVVQAWCNNDFEGVVFADAPVVVKLAVAKLVEMSANSVAGISSKTSQNIVVESYTVDELPKMVKQMLYSVRKVAM